MFAYRPVDCREVRAVHALLRDHHIDNWCACAEIVDSHKCWGQARVAQRLLEVGSYDDFVNFHRINPLAKLSCISTCPVQMRIPAAQGFDLNAIRITQAQFSIKW